MDFLIYISYQGHRGGSRVKKTSLAHTTDLVEIQKTPKTAPKNTAPNPSNDSLKTATHPQPHHAHNLQTAIPKSGPRHTSEKTIQARDPKPGSYLPPPLTTAPTPS